MPLPIAGAMTAAAGLGRMAGAAMQTAMTAARSSRLAPAFQQLAGKLRTFDPALLVTLMQPAAMKPSDAGKPPPLQPRPPGGALAAALRDALPARPTAAPPHAASHPAPAAMPPPSPRPSLDGTPHAGGELTPLLARAWDHLETTLRGLTTAVVGGRAIGEEMLAIIGPRLHALNADLAPLLQKAAQPPTAATAAAPHADNASAPATDAVTTPPAKSTAAKPAAAHSPAAETEPAPAGPDDAAAAAELLHALQETGERNAMDLVGAQPAPGDAQPAHGHAAKAAADPHAPASPDGAATQSAAATTPTPGKPPAGAPQPGVPS